MRIAGMKRLEVLLIMPLACINYIFAKEINLNRLIIVTF